MSQNWKRRWESVENEPHLRPDATFQPDPAEAHTTPRNPETELEHLRDSVLLEPTLQGIDASQQTRRETFGAWLNQKKDQTSAAGNWGVAVLVGFLGGLFALFGAFVVHFLFPVGSGIGIVAVAIIAPVSEEILKQSGLIYLLEFKPYRVQSRWQIYLASLLAALVFASLENILYTTVYVQPGDVEDFAAFVQYRWTVCTSLHVVCTLISAHGLVWMWERVQKQHEPADLQVAYPFFFTAMLLHGIYNLTVTVVEVSVHPF